MNLNYGMILIMGCPEIYSSLVNVFSISHFSHICGKSIHIYLPYHCLKGYQSCFSYTKHIHYGFKEDSSLCTFCFKGSKLKLNNVVRMKTEREVLGCQQVGRMAYVKRALKRE